MAKRVNYVCSHCGGQDVLCDAFAEWDVVEQKWVLQNTFDKGSYCNDCNGEARLRAVEISPEDYEAEVAKRCEADEPNR